LTRKIDKSFKGNSSLYIACQEGHLDIAAMLLAHGASINLPNKVGSLFFFYVFFDIEVWEQRRVSRH